MRLRQLGFLVVLVVAAACGGKQEGAAGGGDTTPKPGVASLYDRLGKQDAIVAVVDDFVANVSKDPRISDRFRNTDIPALKAKLVDQICEAAGGPCKYTGKDMKTTHTGMAIKDDEFTAMVEDLKRSLDNFKVGPKEQEDLLGALGAMKAEIVGL